jgi:thioredoxin-dependent peroxiredoxin
VKRVLDHVEVVVGLPKVGARAPGFRLPASDGRTIDLKDFAGKQTVVLYFYPKADTPGCTTQACGFRDALADYDRSKIAVLGISPDPIEKVVKFATKFGLNFPLLADADHAVAERYGVWQEKSMYGRKYFGAVRTTFVISKDGTIAGVFEKVKPAGHEQQVLNWLRESRLAKA